MSLILATFGVAFALVGGFIPNTVPQASAATNCGAAGVWAYNREYTFLYNQSWCMQYNVGMGLSPVQLVWQSDGNLVAYQGTAARWASNTSGQGRTLKFQADGNVVIYNSRNVAVWDTKSYTASRIYGYTLEFVPGTPNVARVNYYYAGSFSQERVRFCINNARC